MKLKNHNLKCLFQESVCKEYAVSLEPLNDKIIDIYAIQNQEGVLLTDKIIIVQIFLPNLRKSGMIKVSES